MADTQAPPPLAKSQPSFARKHSTIIKLIGVGALVLVLLIPLEMITGVLSDRLSRRNEAVADITASWGKEQNVIGPVLGIPYQYKFRTMKEIPLGGDKVERREVEETAIANAYFLPEVLNITGDVQTQTLHRGIYDAAVFRAQVKLSGKFGPPDFGALKIDLEDVQWKDAFVTIAVNDLRGTRESILVDWGGMKRPLLPGSQIPGYTTGATALLVDDQPIAQQVEYSVSLDFNGSGGIFFAPFGVQNEATLKSNWADPGFRGAFLPAERSVRSDGLMRNGRSRITAAIIRNNGRRKQATSVSTPRPFRIHFLARNFCRSSMRIVMSSVRSNTACYFSCSYSRHFFFSK